MPVKPLADLASECLVIADALDPARQAFAEARLALVANATRGRELEAMTGKHASVSNIDSPSHPQSLGIPTR